MEHALDLKTLIFGDDAKAKNSSVKIVLAVGSEDRLETVHCLVPYEQPTTTTGNCEPPPPTSDFVS